jgi:hypothetical protein
MTAKSPYRQRLLAGLDGILERVEQDADVVAAVWRAVDATSEALQAELDGLESLIASRGLGGFAGPRWVAQTLFELAWTLELTESGMSESEALATVTNGLPDRRIERLSPSNPLDGSISGLSQAEIPDFIEFKEYQRLFAPARQRGRKPGRSMTPRAPTANTISRDKASEAGRMTLPTWAAKWAADCDLSDAKQYNRARGRYNAARSKWRREFRDKP